MIEGARPTPCDEYSDNLAELALGILTGRERAATLAHVDSCPRCADELEQLSHAADAVARILIDQQLLRPGERLDEADDDAGEIADKWRGWLTKPDFSSSQLTKPPLLRMGNQPMLRTTALIKSGATTRNNNSPRRRDRVRAKK